MVLAHPMPPSGYKAGDILGTHSLRHPQRHLTVYFSSEPLEKESVLMAKQSGHCRGTLSPKGRYALWHQKYRKPSDEIRRITLVCAPNASSSLSKLGRQRVMEKHSMKSLWHNFIENAVAWWGRKSCSVYPMMDLNLRLIVCGV